MTKSNEDLKALGYSVVDASNPVVECGWLMRAPGVDDRAWIAASEDDAWRMAREHARTRASSTASSVGADYAEAFDILVDIQSALVLTAEHNPTASVGSFVSSSTQYDRLNRFLHARQHADGFHICSGQQVHAATYEALCAEIDAAIADAAIARATGEA